MKVCNCNGVISNVPDDWPEEMLQEKQLMRIEEEAPPPPPASLQAAEDAGEDPAGAQKLLKNKPRRKDPAARADRAGGLP